MIKLPPSNKVYIDKSTIAGAGRGVYSRCDIKKGEIIERCPIIEIPKHDASYLNESVLVTYIFYFGKNNERSAISLGFGSIYNHSYKPNTTYRILPREKIIEFKALEDIKKDTEITFNYYHRCSSAAKKNPLWFEV